MEKKKYTVVIPAFNEEEAIVRTIEEVKESINDDYEILVVDDGSADRTYSLAAGCGVRVIKHEVNRGKAAALETGVRNAGGYIVATIDADCTYEAARIKDLVALVENGSDLAIGSRFLGEIKGMKLLNRIGNSVFSFLITSLTGQRITDAQSGLRAFRKDLFFRLAVQAKGLDWETEMTARAVKEGYSAIEIPIQYFERVGESKLNPVKDGYRMFRGIIRGARPLSGVRRYLVRKKIDAHILKGEKILYTGLDGGGIISHHASSNIIHFVGSPLYPIPKGIEWKQENEVDHDYDSVIITNLQDVIDDTGHLRFVREHLRENGRVIIWLTNTNVHAILSWFTLLHLIGHIPHIRYYSGKIQDILMFAGFKPVLFERCNLHVNILVIGEAQ